MLEAEKALAEARTSSSQEEDEWNKAAEKQ